LAIVSGLTIGDYLLWNWSLNGNHDVLALVSGLTMPPLAIAFLWLVALTVTRLLSDRRRGARPARRGRATGITQRIDFLDLPRLSPPFAQDRRLKRRATSP
jgi:hypothetical protein